MNALEFLNKHFCEHALPSQLPAVNFLTEAVKKKPDQSNEAHQKAVKARLKDLGYTATDTGYQRTIDGYELAERVFSSTLPLRDIVHTDGQPQWQVSSKRLCPKGGSSYLIVTPGGYYMRYGLCSALGQQRCNYSHLIHHKKPELGAFDAMLQMTQGQEFPFLILALDNTPVDLKKLRLTYDLRHLVINHPMQPLVRDFSNYPIKEEDF